MELATGEDAGRAPSGSHLSRAAVRRLAHDAQKRLTKQSYDDVLEEVDHFLQSILQTAFRACAYSRKRSIAREHILYAASAMGIEVPTELREAKKDDLVKIRKCNLHAPAQQRKNSALHAEISEASFSRVSKRAASHCKKNLRLSAQARHLLHLLMEHHIMNYLSKRAPVASDMSEDRPTAEALAGALGCSDEHAACLSHFVTRLVNQVPSLLGISQTRTVDGRLVLAAAASLLPELGQVELRKPEGKGLLRVCERILRGRAADKRITSNAAQALASILEALLAQELSRASVTSCYRSFASLSPTDASSSGAVAC